MSKLNVYKIEYLIDKEETTWRACVLSTDQKNAIDFLRTYVGKPCKINYISHQSEVHALTDEAKEMLKTETIKEVSVEKIVEVEKEVEKIVEVEKEVIKEVPVEKIVEKEITTEVFVCPYCEKKFKTLKTLKSHIDKSHK